MRLKEANVPKELRLPNKTKMYTSVATALENFNINSFKLLNNKPNKQGLVLELKTNTGLSKWIDLSDYSDIDSRKIFDDFINNNPYPNVVIVEYGQIMSNGDINIILSDSTKDNYEEMYESMINTFEETADKLIVSIDGEDIKSQDENDIYEPQNNKYGININYYINSTPGKYANFYKSIINSNDYKIESETNNEITYISTTYETNYDVENSIKFQFNGTEKIESNVEKIYINLSAELSIEGNTILENKINSSNNFLELNESKIVEPIGNPQTSNSFVNIDVDLDHMEVSDFIIRIAQAIRSEQTTILEYTAMKSANGVTNEDRSVIDDIIEEEKNHMAALATLLYKQIKVNYSNNMDRANNEFVLPKFGMEIFDNVNEAKLQESLQTTINTICKESYNKNDDFYVGDNESGRIYHGINSALDAVKFLLAHTNDPVTIQVNNDDEDFNDELTESISEIEKSKLELTTKLKQKFNDLLTNGSSKDIYKLDDEELKLLYTYVDNNVNGLAKDIIGWHIRDALSGKKQKIKEDITTYNDEEKNKYNIVADVTYPKEYTQQIDANLSIAIEIFNKKHKGEYEIEKGNVDSNLMHFTLKCFTDNELTDDLAKSICKELCQNSLTSPDYEITLIEN